MTASLITTVQQEKQEPKKEQNKNHQTKTHTTHKLAVF
jgi:hypothetical protein